MSKIIILVFLALLVGGSVVAWSRSTATAPHEARHAARAFAPDEIHRALAGPLPEQKFNDMSVVFTDDR